MIAVIFAFVQQMGARRTCIALASVAILGCVDAFQGGHNCLNLPSSASESGLSRSCRRGASRNPPLGRQRHAERARGVLAASMSEESQGNNREGGMQRRGFLGLVAASGAGLVLPGAAGADMSPMGADVLDRYLTARIPLAKQLTHFTAADRSACVAQT